LIIDYNNTLLTNSLQYFKMLLTEVASKFKMKFNCDIIILASILA